MTAVQSPRPPGTPMIAAAALVAATLVSGCASTTSTSRSGEAEEVMEPQTIYALGIPLNSVPPPGKCRIWRPGRPRSYQNGVGGCERLERRVPEGGWLLRHPEPAPGERDRVELVVYGADGPSMVRVFDTDHGELVTESRAAADLPEPTGMREERIERGRTAIMDGETLYALGIPRSAVPAGQCRVWRPWRSADRQASAVSCAEARDDAEPGSWLLRRVRDPGGADRLVVSLWGEGEPMLERSFDAGTGTLLEEDLPER